MSVFPYAIDDDRTILRVDDNLSELGTLVINQLRSAVFAVEKELGVTASGSLSSVDERISVSLNEDGTLKSSALIAAGLIALPIIDSQVANNAGIKEHKLDLNVSTLNLQSQINAVEVVADNTAVIATTTASNLISHTVGVYGRHEDDNIDITATLLDKDGIPRSSSDLKIALESINNALSAHENLVSAAVQAAHPAAAISVSASGWRELPADASDVQEVLDFIDNQETISTGVDRATLNSNGIPRNARVEKINLDGYANEVVPETRVKAYLAEPSQTEPRDSITNGDDIVTFAPTDNSGYWFDSAFTNVRPGDVLRINYGNGISGMFKILSVRFTPSSDWTVRIDGFNLANRDGDTDGYAYARIDRTRHDIHTDGVLAVAGAPANVIPDGGCSNAIDGVIIGSPRGAMAIGVGFDAGALNENHYNLWLRLYPNGDPNVSTDLPAIDVTGNLGATPGAYTLETIVESTNRAFRAAGYNYRFIAFQHSGEFGIMLADSWNEAAFAIITGEANGTIVDEGSYTFNVIGDATDGYDALGMGASRAVVASPVNSGFSSALGAANLSTIIHRPIKGRDYMVDGSRRDFLKTKAVTQGDGYYEATVQTIFDDVPNGTITSTYRIDQVISDQEIKPGKSVVIQPVDPADSSLTGYGRFIVGDVQYNQLIGYTDILVINACHATADPRGAVLPEDTEVRLYFTEDSVAFNFSNLNGQGDYHRYHEIYVGPISQTSAVERARMPKQNGGGSPDSLLDTNIPNWQIRNVSSKMRGVRLNDSFRYYVRLYILDYDDATGVFDGYIGDPADASPTPGILNPGPRTQGRKNEIVRFYDDSYVNFIELQFRELATGPNGTAVANSANIPKFVDIELFQTPVLDDEMMLIAGVSHNETEVGSITDLRQFGTLSEENFTDSAISFIEAGERYLHANGIVRGFDYLGAGVNDAVLTFSGGIGLVGGSFVAVDTLSCTIPESRDGSATLNYFICLTKNGTLRAIPELQAGGVQFFDNATGEFVESFSFVDIVNNRKDLLILYIANVTIGSMIVNLVSDARRYVNNESINNWSVNIVRSGEVDRSTATFKSLDALQTWVNYYDISDVEVKSITIEGASALSFATDTRLYGGTINLENYLIVTNCQIENCSLNITTTSGLSLLSSELRNSSILYVPSTNPGYVAGDLISAGLGFAVYVADFSRIVDNTFTSTLAQRPPFVFNNTIEGATLQSIIIEGNLFQDVVAGDNCAICLDHIDSTGATAALLKSVSIRNNNCNGTQSIVVAARGLNNVGWYCQGVEISNNRCGSIGYLTSSSATSGYGLVIANNNCTLISTANTAYSSGHSIGNAAQPLGSGHVTIKDNIVFGRIGVYVSSTASVRGSVDVKGNTVYAQLNTTVSKWFNITTEFSAIFVGTSSSSSRILTHVSENNIALIVPDNLTVTTERGIHVNIVGYGNIQNNGIDVAPSNASTASFSTLTLIEASQGAYSAPINVIISGNQLKRFSYPISHYISTVSIGGEGEIVDNYIDNWDVGTNDPVDAISTHNAGVVVSRNKNHRVTIEDICISLGNFVGEDTGFNNTFALMATMDTTPFPVSSPGTGSSYIYTIPSQRLFWFYYNDTGDTINGGFSVPINTFIPFGARIKSIIVDYSWNHSGSPTKFDLKGDLVKGVVLESLFDIDLSGTATGSATETATVSGVFVSDPSVQLIVYYSIDDSAPAYGVLSAIDITYQW